MPYYEPQETNNQRQILGAIIFYLEREPGNVIITGLPGAGKSTLIHEFIEMYNVQLRSYKMYRGYEINLNPNLIDQYSKGWNSNSLLIIDGFDEILNKDVKESIFTFFKERRKTGTRVLMSCRETSDLSNFEPISTIIKLPPYSSSDITNLLSLFEEQKLDTISIQALGRIIRTRRDISQLSELIRKKIDVRQILTSLQDETNYESKLFAPSSSLLVLPEQRPVIIQAKVIQQKLIERIGCNMEEVMKLTSRQFEEFIGEMFEKEGFKVELTQETRDNGKDIILTSESITGKNLYYVECKKWSQDRKVSVGVIQRLHGAVLADRATKGIVVTTASFSDPAIREVKKIEHQMSLMDHVALHQTINKLSNLDKSGDVLL
jgi:HJR/Mrr/RecB family endonuclease